MGRYARLYLNFLRFSFSRAMQFRVDFFFRVGMDSLWYAVHLSFFWVIHEHTSLLGGWTLDQTLVFAATLFMSDAFYMTVFANNLWYLPFLVNRGDLDYYLTRPVSSLYFLSFRDFAANSFLNFLIAAGILVWSLTRYPGGFEAANLAAYAVLFACGLWLHYAITLVFTIPVFWLHSNQGLRQVHYHLDRFSQRPHRIFTGWVRRLLVSVLPYALVVSFPVQALFEGVDMMRILHVFAVTAAVSGFTLWLWGRGLRAYSSASS